METKCLAVDSDFDTANSYVKEWAKRGVSMDCANNMTEAIQKLQSDEYIFVGINGDVIDFMPLLSTMRSITNIPIMIATSNFSTEKEVAALENGATSYSLWHDSPADNVSSVMARIKSKKNTPISNTVFIYKNMLASLSQRIAFINNVKIDLTRQEFDLLHHFMSNEGRVLTYDNIYSLIWNEEYDGSSYETIKGLVKRLRRKINLANGSHIKIQNRWGTGYTLPIDVG